MLGDNLPNAASNTENKKLSGKNMLRRMEVGIRLADGWTDDGERLKNLS